MHIFAALISFFSQFPGGVCPTMAPSITHVMLLANKLGYLQKLCIYTFCVEGHARKKYMSTYREIEIKIVALEFNLSKL